MHSGYEESRNLACEGWALKIIDLLDSHFASLAWTIENQKNPKQGLWNGYLVFFKEYYSSNLNFKGLFTDQ